MKNVIITKAKNKINNFKMGIASGCATGIMMANNLSVKAGFTNDSVSIKENADAEKLMGNVIGIILTIMRYAGVALVVYGVYEIIMSIMNNQPEAKTKGIFMAMAGAVLIALKSILQGMGVIG